MIRHLHAVAACLILLAFLLTSCAGNQPSAVDTTPAPDETAAIAELKAINQAQADFIRRTRRYAQTYDELIAEHLLTAKPSTADTGYDFLLRPSPDAVSYKLIATPASPEARHFFTDQSGVIRAESGKPATADSPEI